MTRNRLLQLFKRHSGSFLLSIAIETRIGERIRHHAVRADATPSKTPSIRIIANCWRSARPIGFCGLER
jgi:hypothetical protein